MKKAILAAAALLAAACQDGGGNVSAEPVNEAAERPAAAKGEQPKTNILQALNGSADQRYLGNLNVRRSGLDVARVMSELRDVAFSAGSACASGSGRPSHVLRAIGLSDAEARSSIRLGFGRYTTAHELIVAIDRIRSAADAQRLAA